MKALWVASTLELDDWCIAGGFVRNLVWDKLHGYQFSTPLNDIDLVYFDVHDISISTERGHEKRLNLLGDFPWSVKNQARMHIRNGDKPYQSTADALTYWVELETIIGVRMTPDGEITLVSPFGIDALFQDTVSINKKRPKPTAFKERINSKKWLEIWPNLRVL